MQKHFPSTNIVAIFFAIICSIFISACATAAKTQEKNYSWDAYQYHLSESQIESINRNLPGDPLKSTTNTPVVLLVSSSNYWKFLKQISSSPFFSDYQYSFTKCERESSGVLTTQIDGTIQECKTSYFTKDMPLMITASQLQNQTISIAVTMTESTGAIQKLDYDTSKDFLFIYQKLPHDSRLLLITPNQLGIPWSYYDKTPQATARQ